jgi:molybdopterin converting factor subunit 1
MMDIRVKLFAVAQDLAGGEEVTLSMPEGSRVSDLIQKLIQHYPAFRDLEHVLRVAVNQEIALPGDSVRGGDEVAIIPPVSGG